MRRISIKLHPIIVGAILLIGCGKSEQEKTDVGITQQDLEKYGECAEIYHSAVTDGDWMPETYYEAACCFAEKGDKELAFDFLEKAIDRGFNEPGLFGIDPELESLHDDPHWQNILDKCKEKKESHLSDINQELKQLCEEDQKDRQGDMSEADWQAVGERDSVRRERTMELYKEGKIRSSTDFFNAALILQHGNDSKAYKKAHEFAMKAAELDPSNGTAKWLAAAAKDRYLWSVDKPQWYGTQFRNANGKWTIEPIDTTAITDKDRRKWSCPSLAEARKRAEQMNRQKE
jgi:tetratricopeptide (TPR) repeat protein